MIGLGVALPEGSGPGPGSTARPRWSDRGMAYSHDTPACTSATAYSREASLENSGESGSYRRDHQKDHHHHQEDQENHQENQEGHIHKDQGIGRTDGSFHGSFLGSSHMSNNWPRYDASTDSYRLNVSTGPSIARDMDPDMASNMDSNMASTIGSNVDSNMGLNDMNANIGPNAQTVYHPANPSLPEPKSRVLRDLGNFEVYQYFGSQQPNDSLIHGNGFHGAGLKGSVPIYESPSLDSLSSFPHKNSVTPVSLISAIPSPSESAFEAGFEARLPSVRSASDTVSLSDSSSSEGWTRSASASLLNWNVNLGSSNLGSNSYTRSNIPSASSGPLVPAPTARPTGRVNSGSSGAPIVETGYKPLYNYRRPSANYSTKYSTMDHSRISSRRTVSTASSQINIPKRNDRAVQEVRLNDTGLNVTFRAPSARVPSSRVPSTRISSARVSSRSGLLGSRPFSSGPASSVPSAYLPSSGSEADWFMGRAGSKRQLTRSISRRSSRILGSPAAFANHRNAVESHNQSSDDVPFQRQVTTMHYTNHKHAGDHQNIEGLAERDYLREYMKEWEESPLLSTSLRNEPQCSAATAKTLLVACVLFPPLWMLLGVGGFDQVFGNIPIRIKRAALVLGTSFFFVVVACLIIGLVIGL